MCLGGVGQREAVIDRYLDRAIKYRLVNGGKASPIILGLAPIGAAGGARDVERALGREDAKIGDRHGARGIAQTHHQAARLEAIQAAHEGILADAVIDDIHALPVRQLANAIDEVFGAVVDDLVAAIGSGESHLLVRTSGADDARAQCVGPLAGDEAQAAGGSLEEDRLVYKRLKGPYYDTYRVSFRSGAKEYRVIYTIIPAENLVLVLTIGARKTLYKTLNGIA